MEHQQASTAAKWQTLMQASTHAGLHQQNVCSCVLFTHDDNPAHVYDHFIQTLQVSPVSLSNRSGSVKGIYTDCLA